MPREKPWALLCAKLPKQSFFNSVLYMLFFYKLTNIELILLDKSYNMCVQYTCFEDINTHKSSCVKIDCS